MSAKKHIIPRLQLADVTTPSFALCGFQRPAGPVRPLDLPTCRKCAKRYALLLPGQPLPGEYSADDVVQWAWYSATISDVPAPISASPQY